MVRLSEKNKNLSFIPAQQSKDVAGFIKINSQSAGVPSGWLECNGQAVSRTTYSELFSVIGTDFGVGDGATTFNLPTIASAVANTEYVIKAYSDILGPSVGVERLDLDLGLVRKVSQRDETIMANYAAMVSNFEVASGHTYTVEANADFVSVDTLTVNGTLTNNGNLIIL